MNRRRRRGHLTCLARLVVLATTGVPAALAGAQPPRTTTARPTPTVTRVSPTVTSMAVQQRRMPSVIDSTIDVARRLLSRLKLVPTVIPRETPDAARDGRVAAQDPAPLTILPAADVPVTLTVYRFVAVESVTVPPVTGQPLALAVRMVARARLVPQHGATSLGSLLATVTGQDPEAGTRVAPGTPVTLTVQVTARVPPVVDRDLSTARQLLARAGLEMAERGSEHSDQVAAGRVTRQHPEPRATVAPGSAVEVWVSLGAHPPAPVLTMPLLEGGTLGDAAIALRPLGMKVTHIDTIVDAARAGRITSQRPGVGKSVHAGDAVAVQLAVAPAQRRVPPVVGLSYDVARGRLADSGFVANQTLIPAPAGTAAGMVTAQSERPGLPRPPGTIVTLTVTMAVVTSPVTIPMPDLVGFREEAAIDSLGMLSPDITTIRVATSRRREDGRVLSHVPEAGEPVAVRVQVVLRVGRYQPPDTTRRPDTTGGGARQDSVPPDTTRGGGATPTVTVPGLVGQTLVEVRRRIAEAGLTLGDVKAKDPSSDSLVLVQRPDSGTPVARGSAVAVELDSVGSPQRDTTIRSDGDGMGGGTLALIIVGALAAIALLVWLATREPIHPNPTPPPTPEPPEKRPPTPKHVTAHLRASDAPAPKVERPAGESVVAFSVSLADAAPLITLDHASDLIAREEVVHVRRP